jgi:hypothetical protein
MRSFSSQGRPMEGKIGAGKANQSLTSSNPKRYYQTAGSMKTIRRLKLEGRFEVSVPVGIIALRRATSMSTLTLQTHDP